MSWGSQAHGPEIGSILKRNEEGGGDDVVETWGRSKKLENCFLLTFEQFMTII